MTDIIYRGDTPTKEYQFLQEDGSPIDLSAATVYVAMRKHKKGGDLFINKATTIYAATEGKVRVTYTETETDFIGDAIAEFEARYADGTILTLGQIKVKFIEDIRK